MNASQYSIRQNRPNQLFAAGAAVLASTLVLSRSSRISSSFPGSKPLEIKEMRFLRLSVCRHVIMLECAM